MPDDISRLRSPPHIRKKATENLPQDLVASVEGLHGNDYFAKLLPILAAMKRSGACN